MQNSAVSTRAMLHQTAATILRHAAIKLSLQDSVLSSIQLGQHLERICIQPYAHNLAPSNNLNHMAA